MPPVLVMISSMFVPICNSNNGKITTFQGVPLFDTCMIAQASLNVKSQYLDC